MREIFRREIRHEKVAQNALLYTTVNKSLYFFWIVLHTETIKVCHTITINVQNYLLGSY